MMNSLQIVGRLAGDIELREPPEGQDWRPFLSGRLAVKTRDPKNPMWLGFSINGTNNGSENGFSEAFINLLVKGRRLALNGRLNSRPRKGLVFTDRNGNESPGLEYGLSCFQSGVTVLDMPLRPGAPESADDQSASEEVPF